MVASFCPLMKLKPNILNRENLFLLSLLFFLPNMAETRLRSVGCEGILLAFFLQLPELFQDPHQHFLALGPCKDQAVFLWSIWGSLEILVPVCSS